MNFTFKLTQQEADGVLNALGQRPYLEVFQLIAKFQQQAGEQLRAAQEVEAKPIEEPKTDENL